MTLTGEIRFDDARNLLKLGLYVAFSGIVFFAPVSVFYLLFWQNWYYLYSMAFAGAVAALATLRFRWPVLRVPLMLLVQVGISLALVSAILKGVHLPSLAPATGAGYLVPGMGVIFGAIAYLLEDDTSLSYRLLNIASILIIAIVFSHQIQSALPLV